MNLKRFTILTQNDSHQTEEFSPILINIEHIVSVKPIKLTTQAQGAIDGYWVRLSNGKKYRAVQVPKSILESLKEELPAVAPSTDSQPIFNSYQ